MNRNTRFLVAGLVFPCLVIAYLLGSAAADAQEPFITWHPIPAPAEAPASLRCFERYGPASGVVCFEAQQPTYPAPTPRKSCGVAP